MENGNEQLRVLSVAPYSKGFGFALLEESDRLVDYGLKMVRPWDEKLLERKLQQLVLRTQPDVLAIEAGVVRSASRAGHGARTLRDFARRAHLPIVELDGSSLRRGLPGRTRLKEAQAIANQFPELKATPLKQRRPWESWPPRMALFSSIAIAVEAQQAAINQSRTE